MHSPWVDTSVQVKQKCADSSIWPWPGSNKNAVYYRLAPALKAAGLTKTKKGSATSEYLRGALGPGLLVDEFAIA
jgi:hypothetical protein